MTGRSASQHVWRCDCCGEEFTGLPMSLAFSEPVDWGALDAQTRAASSLDDDFCEVRHSDGRVDRLVRCLLPLPVLELEDAFTFLVWASVSEASWSVYKAGFGNGVYAKDGCFAYLMHDIPDYPPAFALALDLWFQPEGLRPIVEFHDADHPLVEAQRRGIEMMQIERWAAWSHG